jgi:thioredoxin reductase (NADPH)
MRTAESVCEGGATDEGPLAETPDTYGAFPRLSEPQIEMLAAAGERRPVEPGDVLFAEGEESQDFFVVLSGKIAVIQEVDGQRQIIRVHGPGRFLGELGLLEGQPSFLGAVACGRGAVLAVPAERLRAIVAGNPVLGDLILRAYLVRRSLLIQHGAGFRIIGSCHSPDTRRLREFAARNRLPHRWLDVEQDSQAETLLRRFGISPAEMPVVIWGGKRLLRNPSNAELAAIAGVNRPAPGPVRCDLLVIGAGPGGLAAAVYGAADGLATTVVDRIATGGQAGTSSRIENYLGFPSGISGAELADRAVLQADKFGARVVVPAKAAGLAAHDAYYEVGFDDGGSMLARTIVIATGALYRRPDVPGLSEFEGNGVYYAATELEALACGDRAVAVLGGGNSAGQAAVFLAERVPKVYLIVREHDLGAGMSRYLVDRIERHPRIEPWLGHEVVGVEGTFALEAVIVRDNSTGEHRTLEVPNLFVFIGARPGTGWLRGTLALDDRGYLHTGAETPAEGTWQRFGRRPFTLETSRPGVFAVGDVRSGSTKRVASAVGEGAMAVHMVHRHLAEIGR